VAGEGRCEWGAVAVKGEGKKQSAIHCPYRCREGSFKCRGVAPVGRIGDFFVRRSFVPWRGGHSFESAVQIASDCGSTAAVVGAGRPMMLGLRGCFCAGLWHGTLGTIGIQLAC